MKFNQMNESYKYNELSRTNNVLYTEFSVPII